MTVSLSILDQTTIDDTIAQLRAVEKSLVRAFKGGLKAGGAYLAERISDGIPYDTGSMEDSIYVQEGVVGVAAPHAAFVEELHPTNPHHIKRRVVESQDAMVQVISDTTDRLTATGGGPESISHGFRDRPGFIPPAAFHGSRKTKRQAARRRKAAR